jgi:hypothetical protein
MNLQRERWILRRGDGKILVGQKQNYEWRNIEDVKDARIATYMSEKKAMSAADSHDWTNSKYGYSVYAERVQEIYVSF